MRKQLIWAVIVIMVVISVGIILNNEPVNDPQPEIVQDQSQETGESVITENGSSEHVIVYSDSGYSPSNLTIKQGDVVIFKNESSSGMWTASAIHPTHTVYPGTDIKNCGVQEGMFDSCQSFLGGQEWPFVFNEVGEWGYHNHVRASHFGKIIVE